jgi:bleomycin hydrolase
MGSAPSKPIEHVKAETVSEKKEYKPLPSVSSPPVSVDGSLSLKSVSDWEAAASASAKTRLARAVLAHTNLNSALVRREAFIADPHVFNTELDFKTGPVTNQKSSGRCWLFATTNVLRYEIMKKLNLKEFQLSQVRTTAWLALMMAKEGWQSYLFFWDKLNKANYYLELSIQEAGRPLDDRLISHLAGDLISDGGQWDMVVNLLEVTNDAIYFLGSC